MRPAANSQSPSYSQPLDSSNNPALTYDLPIGEPDLNVHPRDPNYSYNIPEGSGREVTVPGDTSSAVPAQKTGELMILLLLRFAVILSNF